MYPLTVRKKMPYGRHWVGDEEVQAVLEVLTSGYLTTGPQVERFEEAFCHYLGAKYAVATSSCSAALHLSLMALDLKPGDEVITTVFTFVATANAILHTGATPVFVDIDPVTYNLNLDQAAERITPRTKAIVIVHYGGHPCPMDAVRTLAEKNRLSIVEDASHAVGAADRGKKIGADSLAACFSFHPVKNMTTAEGGIIATNSEALAKFCRAGRLHGIVEDWHSREKTGNTSYPQMEFLGFKYNMTDLQAVIGLCQLKKLDDFNLRRGKIADFYFSELSRYPEIILPYRSDGVRHSWHLFPIRLHPDRLKISRDDFMQALLKKSIVTGIHYLPIHCQNYYRRRFHFTKGDFPVAEAVYDSILSIPIYPQMSDADAQYVAGSLGEIIREFRR